MDLAETRSATPTETHLLGSKDRDLAKDFAHLKDGLFDIWSTSAVFSHDPHGAPEHLARLDLAKGGNELFGDGWSQIWELFHHFPDEGNDIDGRRVVGVAQKVHEDVDDIGGDFRELDSTRVDALDQELTVLEVLSVSFCARSLLMILRQRTLSYSCSIVLVSCFFKNSTTSSTLRLVTISRATWIALRLTSMSGLTSQHL